MAWMAGGHGWPGEPDRLLRLLAWGVDGDSVPTKARKSGAVPNTPLQVPLQDLLHDYVAEPQVPKFSAW